MTNCTMCTKFGECPWRSDPNGYCSAYEQRAMTNADRIRMMTDEELAEFLQDVVIFGGTNSCSNKLMPWLDWLKQDEAKEDE